MARVRWWMRSEIVPSAAREGVPSQLGQRQEDRQMVVVNYQKPRLTVIQMSLVTHRAKFRNAYRKRGGTSHSCALTPAHKMTRSGRTTRPNKFYGIEKPPNITYL